jgi:Domain of unknown function (DUF397)
MGHTLDNVIWRKSSYSGSNGGNCVEVALLSGDRRAVRDSKDPGGPNLRFSRDEWRAFTTSIKRGELGLD